MHIKFIECIYLDIKVLLRLILTLNYFILTLKFFYLSWHPLQFCRCMRINFIEYIYLDIKFLVYFILTSIAVLEDYAYKIHRVYLSWHQSSFTSYLDIELFYLDIEVLLFILTSIAISKEHAYKFHRKYLSWHSIIVIFILTLHHIYILSWHPLQFWRIIHINFIEYIYLDNELFYLDIQVLLSILTSIARSMSINLMGFIHLDIIILFI